MKDFSLEESFLFDMMMCMNEEQQKYYEDEWAKLKLSDKPGKSGWRTAVPAPDFVQFIAWLKEHGVNGKALDLGCGGGRHSILLAKNGFETYGIDFAESAIRLATKNSGAAGVDNLTEFKTGNALDLTYRDGYFDVVNDDGCLHHIDPKDWSTYLHNITRVIKNGGTLRIKAFSKNCTYFEENTSATSPQWIQLNDSGFTYFFSEENIRELFSKSFEILRLEENAHTETDAKRFFFVIMRAL
jgi:ubiquinone/menaquinone biosynthesis C-methylase UbiE